MVEHKHTGTPTKHVGRIKVMGVGGAGCNAVNRMLDDGITGVEFCAVNTDLQILSQSQAPEHLPIGTRLTKGLGAGAKPEIGQNAAQESIEDIRHALEGFDMLFLTAGMGGGTGTGAAPIIAECARELGILTVAVVTMPFDFEGHRRNTVATQGLAELRPCVDTLLVIANSRIFDLIDQTTPIKEAFRRIDEVLKQAIQGITSIISETAIINVDFNDVRTVLANRGEAIMGIGSAQGDNRAIQATQLALENPLIENNDFRNAGALLAKVIGGSDFSMAEFHVISEQLGAFCRTDAEIILGLDLDENLKDRIKVVIVATDFYAHAADPPRSPDASKGRASTQEASFLQGFMDSATPAGAASKYAPPPPETPPSVPENRSFAAEHGDLDTPAFLRRRRRF